MDHLQLIQSKIYEIRGQKVMLDFDLAELYQVETKRLKEQVKRNIERFPEDFMFVLSTQEWKELVANSDQLPATMKHSYVAPFAFTQEGVAMLSGILRSGIAVQVNISIMRAFVKMRQIVLEAPLDKISLLQKEMRNLKDYIEDIFADQNTINEDTSIQLELINQTLAELQAQNRQPKERRRIGYELPGNNNDK